MFWQKVYMADVIFGNPTFFRDFNLKLLQYGDAQPPDPAEYTPPDFETMYGWALDSVRSNSIENTAKSTWFYNQWIIQKEDDPNLNYGVFVRSIEDGDSEDGLMDHVCYNYRRFIDNAGYWEEPISNWDIRIRVNDHEPWTAYPSNPAGWVNGVPFGTKIPYPTSTPEPLIIDAQPHAVPETGTIRDVSFLNRNQYEYFGYAYASGNPPLYVDVTNLDTNTIAHIQLTPNYCYAIGNPFPGTIGAGRYHVVTNSFDAYFNKDGGTNYFFDGFLGNNVNNETSRNQKLLPFYLHPPAPNPVTHSTVLNFSLSQPGHAQLFVYDISGRLVKVLLDGQCNAGQQTLTWDGTDSVGKPIANGVYTVMLSSSSGQLTKRVVVAR